MDLLRVKLLVHSTLLILLAVCAALEAFRRTTGRLSQRNRSAQSVDGRSRLGDDAPG